MGSNQGLNSVLSSESLMLALPECAHHARPGTAMYKFLAAAAEDVLTPMFGPNILPMARPFGPFGYINFPYRRMGTIDSLNLFGLDELFIFAFYWENRNIYRRVADVGANIGLHSLIMSRCGYDVTSYEPDPTHILMLRETLRLNALTDVGIVESAVSDRSGEVEFIRVLNNTTGSHIAGAKPNPYGDTECFQVTTVPASNIIGKFDLVKVDAEGQEAVIILSTCSAQWDYTDVILEIGSVKNAEAIYEHCLDLNLSMFVQKTGWRRARNVEDVPVSYHEGSAFITRRSSMPGFKVSN